MISADGGLPAHRYTPQMIQRWPSWSELASVRPPLPCPLALELATKKRNKMVPSIFLFLLQGTPYSTI